MIGWLIAWWNARRRAIDLDVLWPLCKTNATANGMSLDYAKAAFAVHAFHDPAWLCLPHDEIVKIIDGLE